MKNYTLKSIVCAMGICLSVPFFSYAEFDQYNYYDSPVSEMGPTIRDFKGNSWRGTNSLGDWNLYFKVNPDWDPLDPSSPMYVWGPSRFDMDSVKFTGTNYIGLINAFYGGGYYNIVDSTFESDDGELGTRLANTDFNGNAIKDGMYEITTSLFKDSTSIAVNPQSDGGSPGVEISGSTFQDNTDINVADGGTLSITDSVVNLANEDIMDKYLGSNSFLVSSINQIGLLLTRFFELSFGWHDQPAIAGQDSITYSFNGLTASSGLPWFTFSYFRFNNNHFEFYQEVKACSFITAFSYSIMYFMWDFQAFFAYVQQFIYWYYPLQDALNSQYWRYWNTDTQQQENTNLAGVLYNITWYLGQMFLMNTWEADTELSQPIEDLNNTFQDLDSSEDSIWNSVSSAFNGFSPDSSDVTELSAIGWVSNYLQQIFVSLGAFNIPIMVALMLGVCMQFIGYFKYKY